MRLQTNLRLPTRQRLDGHHEMRKAIFYQISTRTFSQRVFSQRAFMLTLPAAAVLAPRAASADQKPIGVWGWTTGSATYVRIRPGAQTPIVAKVPRRTQLMVWGTYSGWYRVETTDHKFGWIYHDYASVPKAEKLHELSHFKAKRASDNAGHQVLYGNPSLLKKYYVRYKAPGAKRGLAKQGVQLVSAIAAPSKTVKLAVDPITKPTRRVPVKATYKKVVSKSVVVKTVKPRVPSMPIVETSPRVVMVPSAPDNSTPVAPTASAPRPVVATSKKVVTRVTRKVVTRRSESTREATAVTALPTGQLPRITAEDIMKARQEHLRNQPSFRGKLRPEYQPRSTPRPLTGPADGSVVQPTAFEFDPILNQDAIIASLKTAATKPETVKPMPITGTFSRGGSPRDYARWAQANNKFGDGMAKQALSYRGMPYISGASNPHRGFDCSGLVYYLLRTRGYNPPRTASSLTSVGNSVSKSALKPGDLVFFANTYKRGVSHIGVYIGNGNFVHAANSGSGVKTDSLNSSYYRRKYWGARRVK
jgi:cell wall-associated NlpC family hydrolase